MRFYFNNTATTEFYTLSLHDALPISRRGAGEDRVVRDAGVRVHGPLGRDRGCGSLPAERRRARGARLGDHRDRRSRSEEHTSELQSLTNLVCRLLLEKKKINNNITKY